MTPEKYKQWQLDNNLLDRLLKRELTLEQVEGAGMSPTMVDEYRDWWDIVSSDHSVDRSDRELKEPLAYSPAEVAALRFNGRRQQSFCQRAKNSPTERVANSNYAWMYFFRIANELTASKKVRASARPTVSIDANGAFLDSVATRKLGLFPWRLITLVNFQRAQRRLNGQFSVSVNTYIPTLTPTPKPP